MSAPSVKVAVAGMCGLALVATLLGLAHVARRQEVIQLGYQLARATEELSDNQEENRRLRLEKSILTNPERIERLAESLGMRQPGPEQIRIVRGSSVAHDQAPTETRQAPAGTRQARLERASRTTDPAAPTPESASP